MKVKNCFHPFFTLLVIFMTGSFSLSGQEYNIRDLDGQVINTCSGTFHDSGGAAGDYGNNESYHVTFCSTTGKITLDFTTFSLRPEGGDTLAIYDGSDLSAPLIGKYTGSGMTFSVPSSGSCLTCVFTSDGALTSGGWSASVSCCPDPAVNFSGLNTAYDIRLDAPATLSATPAGGVFSGAGITGTTFNCVTAGVGTHTIQYAYTDAHGCITTVSRTTTVKDYNLRAGARLIDNIADWCSSAAAYSNTTATGDGAAGSCWSGGTDHNVWFAFVATGSGFNVNVITGGTQGTMRGQQVAIWNQAGTQVACNDAGWNYSGTLTLGVDTLKTGHTYYISVDDQTTHGTFTLCTDNEAGYDFRSNALQIGSIDAYCSTDARFSNRFATPDGLAGLCWSGGTDHNVWFSFTAPGNAAKIDVKTGGVNGTMRGQQIALWNASGARVGCIDAGWNYSGTLSLSMDTLTAGHSYYISVDDQTTHGTFTLCVDDQVDYDFKSGAKVLSGTDNWCSAAAEYQNTYATRDGTAGTCWSGGTDHNVWFSFIATGNAVKIEVKTGGLNGTMRGQQIALWNAAGANIACIDAGWNFSGTLGLNMDTLTAGHTYYISVDDQTTHGTFTLCVDDQVDYDFRSGAQPLIEMDNWCSSDAQYQNTYATRDGAAGSCWSGGTDHNVWFEFVAETGGIRVDVKTGGTYGTMRGQQIALWNEAGAQVACNDAGWNFSGTLSLSIDTLTAGRHYFISVDDQTTHGTFSLCLNNKLGFDFREDARIISDLDYWCSSDAAYQNTYATRDGSAGSCWSGGTDHNVWFRFVAVSGQVDIQVKTGGAQGTMRGQQIALWNSNGVQVACIDGGWNYSGTLSLIADTLTAGNVYYVSVDDQTTHGTFTLCANSHSGYDFKSGAVLLPADGLWCSADATYSNRFATRDESAASCWSGGTDHNVWFTFVAAARSARVDIRTGGSYGTMRGQQAAIWNEAGNLVACVDAGWNYSGLLSLGIDSLTIGHQYYISIDDQTTHGTFSICLDNVPGYDFRSDALSLTETDNWCSADAAYQNSFATRDGVAGSCWSGGTDHNVWFSFQAASHSAEVMVKTGGTFGTMRGQQIAIWNASGMQVACMDAGWNYSGVLSLTADTLTAGRTYYISVDDQTTHGTFSLCLNSAPGYDFKTGALLLADQDNWCGSDAAYDNRFATRDAAAGSCWSGGTDHNVWFRFVAVSGRAQVDVKTGGSWGTMRGQQIAIWNAAGTQLACADGGWNFSGDLALNVDTLTAGHTYYISVDDQTTHGTFTLCLNNRTGFDFRSGAVVLTDLDHWCSANALYDNRYSTADQAAGSCWSGGVDHNVWFTFTALFDTATIQLTTGGVYGTMRGQQMAVWTAAGVQVACANTAWNYSGGTTLVLNTLIPGNVYYISVDDRTTSGTFSLCINNVSGREYWAIASGNWNVPSNWSRTEGGPPASAKPGIGNVVHIKGYQITVTGAEAAAKIDMPVANQHTSLTVDGGSLQVNGNVSVSNSGANYNGLLEVINGGALNIANNLTFTRSGGNSPFGLQVTGNSTLQTGNDLMVFSTAGTTTSNSFAVSGNGAVTVGRDLTLSYTGGQKTSLSLAGSAVLNAMRDVYLTSTAQNTVEIQLSNNAVFNLYGNFRSGSPAYGSFLSTGNSTLAFRGTSYLQTWPGNLAAGTDRFTYQHVIINNSKVTAPQVSLGGPVTLSGNLTLTRGIVRTTAVNLLLLPAGSSVSGASSLSFVDGPVSKTGNTAFTFPVGNAGNYKPLSITAPALPADAFTVQYIAANPHPTYSNLLRVPSLDNISECEYWIMTRTAGTSGVQPTLTWDGQSCCMGNPANVRVAAWDGSQWTDKGNGGTTGTASAGTIMAAVPVSAASSVFSFANTLPVVSFSGLVGPYCESAAPVLLTGSPLSSDGRFSGSGIMDNGNGTASFDPAAAGPGTFTITYTYTDPATGCANLSTQQVTVYGKPTASINQDITVCAGSTAELNLFFTGTAPWNYTYTDGTTDHSSVTSLNPLTITTNIPGTYAVTALTDAHGCIGTDFGSNATISNYPAPAKPVIDTTGPVSFCEGGSVILSTAAAGNFAVWSTGVSGYEITVSETGDYHVRVVDSHGCVSPVSDDTHITVNKLPRKPFSITGLSSACQNGPALALSTVAAYATTYTWQVTPAAAGSFSGNTSSVLLTWNPLFTGVATITASGVNALCGEGPVSDPLVVTVNALPDDPGPVTGNADVCRNSAGIVFSVDPVLHATSYIWSIPSGAAITSGSNTNSITVTFGAGAASGNVTVTAVNGCGTSNLSSALAISLHDRPVPALTGTSAAGVNELCTYRTDTGMTGYSWGLSAGGQVVTGGTASDDSVVVRWITAGSQWVAVNYENGNGCSALIPAQLTVTVTDLPAKPATPTGTTVLCSGSPATGYTTTGATGATSYLWSVTPAEAGSLSGSGLTGTILWNATWYGTAQITVTGHNGSGDGPASDPVNVQVYKRAETGTVYYIGNTSHL